MRLLGRRHNLLSTSTRDPRREIDALRERSADQAAAAVEPGRLYERDRPLSIDAVTDTDEQIAISASFGVTVAWADEVDTPVVIARADSALYCAKREGRNCVRVASDPVSVS